MANKTKATPQKDDAREKGPETPDAALRLRDLSDAAVTKMIKQAKKRGCVTYEQLNAVMPSEEVTSEQIEDILAMLNEMGIDVVESEGGGRGRGRRGGGAREARERGNQVGELVEVTPKTPAKSEARSRSSAPTTRCACSARDGLDRAALAPGRGRHRQAY